jgi:hypothetical protein
MTRGFTSTSVFCVTNIYNTITITGFTGTTVAANTALTFQVNDISLIGKSALAGTVTVQVLDALGQIMTTGFYVYK